MPSLTKPAVIGKPTRWSVLLNNEDKKRMRIWKPKKPPCNPHKKHLQTLSDAKAWRNRFQRNPMAKLASGLFVPQPLRMSPGYPCCCDGFDDGFDGSASGCSLYAKDRALPYGIRIELPTLTSIGTFEDCYRAPTTIDLIWDNNCTYLRSLENLCFDDITVETGACVSSASCTLDTRLVGAEVFLDIEVIIGGTGWSTTWTKTIGGFSLANKPSLVTLSEELTSVVNGGTNACKTTGSCTITSLSQSATPSGNLTKSPHHPCFTNYPLVLSDLVVTFPDDTYPAFNPYHCCTNYVGDPGSEHEWPGPVVCELCNNCSSRCYSPLEFCWGYNDPLNYWSMACNDLTIKITNCDTIDVWLGVDYGAEECCGNGLSFTVFRGPISMPLDGTNINVDVPLFSQYQYCGITGTPSVNVSSV